MSVQKHCCSVLLTVVGDDLDPDAVSEALGMEPDQAWRRGERKSYRRPDGTLRHFDSVYEDGGWKKFMPSRYEGMKLHDQIGLWVARLRDLGDAIRSLRERGWIAELDCFTATVDVLVFPNEELREIASLGVDLGLTISLGDKPGTQGATPDL